MINENVNITVVKITMLYIRQKLMAVLPVHNNKCVILLAKFTILLHKTIRVCLFLVALVVVAGCGCGEKQDETVPVPVLAPGAG